MKNMRCPSCRKYLRMIKKEIGLYECSDKDCNTIIQKINKTNEKQPQQTLGEQQ